MAAQDIAAAPLDEGQLFGIGEAASRAGVSERALRYYQELGLIEPSGRTRGGLRRYSEANIARVVRIRELQSLVGFNLDEIKVVLGNDDRLEKLRKVYRAERPEGARRRQLIEEGITLRRELVVTIQTKLARLQEFLDGENAAVERLRALLADTAEPDDDGGVKAPGRRP